MSVQNHPYEIPTEAIEWDVPTWKRAFDHWETAVASLGDTPHDALELGGRRGGGALFLAGRFGLHVTCSDLGGPHVEASSIHKKYNVDGLITYADVDATSVPFPDASFDVVIFKSILGDIGGACGSEGIAKAVHEMARVLRKGGVLLFAENLAATPLHKWARRNALVPGRTHGSTWSSKNWNGY